MTEQITLEQIEKWADTEAGCLRYYGMREHREALNVDSDLYRDIQSIGYTKRPMELHRRCAPVSLTSDGPIGPEMNLNDLHVVYTWSRENTFTPLEIYLKLFPEKKIQIIERIMNLTKCILLIGPPGCGKGTLSDNIVGEFYIPHVSTGDIVRKGMKDDTELGKKMKDYLGKGLLVPDDMSTDMLKKFLDTFQMTTFILDGFPRTLPQAKEMKSILRKHGAAISAIIFLQVPEAELIRRVEHRDRPDDKGVIHTRMEAYKKQTIPALEYLKKEYKDKFFEINGDRPGPVVYQQVRALLSF